MKKDEIQVRIESTFPLDEQMPIPEKKQSSLFEIVFVCLVLARSIHLILAEQKTISIKTLEHFVVIYIPLGISIQNSRFQHQKSLFGTVFSFIRLILYFGIGWTVSGIFNSQRDTLANFLFFVCFQRVLTSLSLLYKAYKKRTVDDRFWNACVVIIPILPWFMCYLQSIGSSFYFWYVIGVVLDVNAFIVMEFIRQKYNHQTMLLAENKKTTFILFAMLSLFLYEIRPFAEYPENIAGVAMDFVHFILGCVGLLCLYSMYSMYTILINRAEEFAWTGWKAAVFTWGHLLVQGSALITIAGVHLVSMNIFYPASITEGLPLNLTIPITDLFIPTIVMNSTGIEYLSALKTYYSGFSKTSISSRYVSFMVTGMGSYCTMIALMECSLGLRKKENKIYAVALLAMGLSGIAIGSILQWQNVNLVIPLVAASSLLGLLVIFQLIGSRN